MAGLLISAWILLSLCAGTAVWAAEASIDVLRAERLVQVRYHEGVPFEEAHALSAVGVSRLIEMLPDPEYTQHRSNIVLALGMSGRPGAYEALERYASQDPHEPVTATEYQARMNVPPAMGHLARQDDRALRYLLWSVREYPQPTRWTYQHLDGERLARLLRRAAVSGLGISGRPDASRELRGLLSRAKHERGVGSKWLGHLENTIGLCDRVRSEGPLQVFAPDTMESSQER